MIDSLIELDRTLFLALNELHAPWLDPVMYWVSDTAIWLPLYAFLLYHVVKLPRSRAVVAVLCIAAGITMADQLSSKLIRPRVQRPRPTRDLQISSQVHTVNEYRGGQFGFPSSHAANTFCVAVLLTLILRQRWLLLLFAWAAVVSYSRIYLGVHYPGDILAGALLGSACGLIAFNLHQHGCRLSEKWIVQKKGRQGP
jgi:undecaprenyl-diphosphatase